MAVDAFLHRVDINERQHVLAGQHRGPAGQLRQEQPLGLLRLPDIPPGEGAQERAQRGRRADPAEQAGHRAVAQQVHVIDAAGAGGHPRDQAADLQRRADPALAGGIDVPRDQLAEPGALGQRHDRDQPGMRHEIRVIKGRVRPREAMQQSHLTGVLSGGLLEASDTPIVPVQRAPFAFDTPE